MRVRFAIVISILVLAYSYLLFNLYRIQVLNNTNYLARAESQYAASGVLKAPRGGIFFTDKEGNSLPAVLNKDFPVIYAVPKVIGDASETSNLLAPILGIPVEELNKKLSKKEDLYEILAKKASSEILSKVKDLKIKGIYTDIESDRFYPFGPLMAQVLGFVAPDKNSDGESGRYGLESYYEKSLSGKAGETDSGKIIAPKKGEDLNLTIDPNIQIEVQKIINRLVTTFKAKGGSIIVEDPKTGKILAMESLPSFDPNNYGKFNLESFLNPTIQTIFEPGSVFKVITMAAGLDAGKITPDTTYVDTGVLKVSGREIKNWDLKAHGKLTMANVLEQSVNTGAAFAERQTGHVLFRSYLDKFGFSEKTGVDLPGELSGDIKRLKPGAPEVAFATASFGQGVAITQLEIINAFSAIANGGHLMRPYINNTIEPIEIRRVISANSAKLVTDMMISAVDKAGVGHIKGYSLAGKTGTAQIPDFKKGGYVPNEVIDTYIGFGPTTDSKFVILIKLDEPEGAPLAGVTVVPAFRDLAQFIINYYNIPPDRINSN
ncbi:MAG: penicillin-binding protein 2 [Patescibacteria group bacterium]